MVQSAKIKCNKCVVVDLHLPPKNYKKNTDTLIFWVDTLSRKKLNEYIKYYQELRQELLEFYPWGYGLSAALVVFDYSLLSAPDYAFFRTRIILAGGAPRDSEGKNQNQWIKDYKEVI